MIVFTKQELVDELFRQRDESDRRSKLLDAAKERAVEADAAYQKEIAAKDATIAELGEHRQQPAFRGSVASVPGPLATLG